MERLTSGLRVQPQNRAEEKGREPVHRALGAMSDGIRSPPMRDLRFRGFGEPLTALAGSEFCCKVLVTPLKSGRDPGSIFPGRTSVAQAFLSGGSKTMKHLSVLILLAISAMAHENHIQPVIAPEPSTMR